MRLARIPTMMDFVNNGFIDPHLFIDYAGSYYEFLKKWIKNTQNFFLHIELHYNSFHVNFLTDGECMKFYY